MDIPDGATQLGTLVGALVALLTLVGGALEYKRQNALKRAEHFGELRRAFKDNEAFRNICGLLETDSPELEAVPFEAKRDFLGHFEEVAISLNSGLIRPHVAHYMFGYYAIRCNESTYFWNTVNKRATYWSLFLHFANDMKALERESAFSPRLYRY